MQQKKSDIFLNLYKLGFGRFSQKGMRNGDFLLIPCINDLMGSSLV